MSKLVYHVKLLHREPVIFHKLVDVKAIGVAGGHTARRGVGLVEIAHFLEFGHLVADGGRRKRNISVAGQIFRSNRLARGDICIYH